MALRSDNIAVALLCRPSGTLEEIVYDELGVQNQLTPGQKFSRIVATFHARKANRFLRTIQVSGSALDWELALTLPRGLLPLSFSGTVGPHGIIIIGSKEPLGAAATPVRLPNLAEKSSEAIMSAINELRNRTEEKAKAQEKLQQQLFELNQALTTQLENSKPARIQSALGSNNMRLLEIAAHDLRNPLSGVLAATEYLIEDAGRLLEPHHVTLLRSIESSAGLMLQLLRDMLEIPTISPKRIKLDRHTTDVGLLVEHAVAANRPLAVSSKVCLEVRLQRPLPSLSADGVKLTHALAGLLSSAIRSCHAGSSLELVAGANAGHVVLTLRHEATGEPDDVLGSLFHHLNPTRQRRRLADERASLNVGYLKRVVEAHHGTLEFKADRKQESAVILTLPVAKGKSAAVQKTREGSGAN